MDVDTELLRAFLGVAEHGGFTRAAAALHRTQSAVSVQVQKLEARLGRVLFARVGRTVRLTPDGELFCGYARRLLALADEAGAALARPPLGGPVRLGAMDDYATRVLPPLLRRFQLETADVRLEVQTGLTGAMLPRLGRDLDLVLAMHPAGTGSGQVLRREAAVWIGPADTRPEEAAVLPLALYPAGCLFRAWAVAALDGIGRPWRPAYESASLGAVEAAVAAGLAVGVGKAGTAAPGLRRLAACAGLPALPVAEIALHRARGRLAPAAVLLADFLADELASTPAPGKLTS